ncbi:translation initiation factor eIF4e [Ascodesmis nigricans]|uniref:Translation initiation factor eIF4e n=1 Tax=Ascodesmis nigricans TaxID=341454 RepID=A0A4S2N813_9PEZI|nr:translation initiation factor eIF4e [Ascodesmis nigricans]
MADPRAPAPLNTQDITPVSAGTSPATPGSEKRAELRRTMLKKLRPYPLRHEWVFWHERNNPDATEEEWADQLKEVTQINTVQGFWQVFNNFPFVTLALRDSLHLFKKNVKPIWEDPRNTNGGAWTFRVPKQQSQEFWKEALMMAIGEILQDVVEKGDDICGVSISIRFKSHLVSVWNRDGNNETSVNAIQTTILENLPDALKPQPQNIYYKKHSAHKSFKGEATKPST